MKGAKLSGIFCFALALLGIFLRFKRTSDLRSSLHKRTAKRALERSHFWAGSTKINQTSNTTEPWRPGHKKHRYHPSLASIIMPACPC
jgi:hypothetical protein